MPKTILLLLLFIVFLIQGCEKKVFSKKYFLQKTPISCLGMERGGDIFVKKMIKESYFLKRYLLKNSCPYVIKITAKTINNCTSPRARSLGSDFDGYLRYEVYYKGKLFYRVQKDFKGKLSKKTSDELIAKMKSDLIFK
jgi:hypothetical protein